MNGQITLDDYQQSKYFDRHGHVKECPEWVGKKRCGNCKYWQILPEYDQPPCGWGIRGLCGSHVSRNQYTTSQVAYCQEWEKKEVNI